MDINRETAMSLWNKRYGKADKVMDFAGREMAKAAYDNRNSKYGWNLDHILPQSRGGKTTESNLVCCHILTNDEKKDSFPCFNANGIRFEIRKVENHYEIREVKSGKKDTGNKDAGKKNTGDSEEEEDVNFYDAAAGIRLYKNLKGVQNRKPFVGVVIIEINGMDSTAVIDFIRKLFEGCSFSFNGMGQYVSNGDDKSCLVAIKNFDLPQQSDTMEMLDKCVLLNTYLKDYFLRKGIISRYMLFFGVHTDDDSRLESLESTNLFGFNRILGTRGPVLVSDMALSNHLYVNSLVVSNTTAKKDIAGHDPIGEDMLEYPVYEYDWVFNNLSNNLKKE